MPYDINNLPSMPADIPAVLIIGLTAECRPLCAHLSLVPFDPENREQTTRGTAQSILTCLPPPPRGVKYWAVVPVSSLVPVVMAATGDEHWPSPESSSDYAQRMACEENKAILAEQKAWAKHREAEAEKARRRKRVAAKRKGRK